MGTVPEPAVWTVPGARLSTLHHPGTARPRSPLGPCLLPYRTVTYLGNAPSRIGGRTGLLTRLPKKVLEHNSAVICCGSVSGGPRGATRHQVRSYTDLGRYVFCGYCLPARLKISRRHSVTYYRAVSQEDTGAFNLHHTQRRHNTVTFSVDQARLWSVPSLVVGSSHESPARCRGQEPCAMPLSTERREQ